MAINKNVSVFVINLARDVERRVHMHALLESLNIEAEFVSAIEGKLLDDDELTIYDRKKALKIYGVDMLPGEFGCYLSHLALYERMVVEDLPYALIFEDDIEIKAELPNIVNALVQDEKHDWEVVRLDTMRPHVREPKNAKFKGRAVQTLEDGTLFKLNTHVLGGGAYLMSLSGAKKMVVYGRHIFMPIDQTLDRFWENGIAPYVVRPLPVKQRVDVVSSIGDRSGDRNQNEPFSHYLYRRLQRIKDSIKKRWYCLFN